MCVKVAEVVAVAAVDACPVLGMALWQEDTAVEVMDMALRLVAEDMVSVVAVIACQHRLMHKIQYRQVSMECILSVLHLL